MNQIILKKGKEKAILQRHPWLFSGAISKVIGNPKNGEPIEVLSDSNQFLGIASFSEYSQIRARMWSFEREEIDLAFFKEKIRLAISRREKYRKFSNDNAWRISTCRI